MKKNVFFMLTLVFVLMLVFVSCEKKDDSVDPEPNPTSSCITVKDLSAHFEGIKAIKFINDTEGWLVGANIGNLSKRTLLHTNDGGLNWTVINTDLKVNHVTSSVNEPFIKFYNSTDAYMIGEYNASTGGKELKYTTNKGQTWTIISNVGNWDAFDVNNTNAVFIGHDIYQLDDALIIVSNSSHTVTQTVDLPSSIDFFVKNDMHLAENGTIITAVSRPNISSSLYIAKSVNNGQDWVYTVIDLEYIDDIEFPTDNVGYISGSVGFDGFLYKTTNGGDTWVKKSLPVLFDNIEFFDDQNGLGVIEGHIYKTTDGAENWTEMSCISSTDNNPNRGVAFVSLDKWYAIGSRWVSSESKTYSEFYIYEE
ncbi:MAG: hypothetical protein DRI84_07825 [Bacteroidetes bacterium]|nr:MAG: hypothetical protein DRI84_07825 [Bacteroidota bacterium]